MLEGAPAIPQRDRYQGSDRLSSSSSVAVAFGGRLSRCFESFVMMKGTESFCCRRVALIGKKGTRSEMTENGRMLSKAKLV